jgi:hypothetical protein
MWRKRLVVALTFFLLVGLLAAAALLAVGGEARAVGESGYYYEAIDVDVSILPDHDVRITETQRFVYTTGSFNYGYRWIPTSDVEWIGDVRVSGSGRPYPHDAAVRGWIEACRTGGAAAGGDTHAFATWTEHERFWIGWWFPEVTNGSLSVELRYLVRGGIVTTDDGGLLFRTDIFEHRDAPVNRGSITVHFPQPVTTEQLKVVSDNGTGMWTRIDETTLQYVASGPIAPGEQCGIRIEFPRGVLLADTGALRGGSSLVWVSSVLILAGAALIGIGTLRRKAESYREAYVNSHSGYPARVDPRLWLFSSLDLLQKHPVRVRRRRQWPPRR